MSLNSRELPLYNGVESCSSSTGASVISIGDSCPLGGIVPIGSSDDVLLLGSPSHQTLAHRLHSSPSPSPLRAYDCMFVLRNSLLSAELMESSSFLDLAHQSLATPSSSSVQVYMITCYLDSNPYTSLTLTTCCCTDGVPCFDSQQPRSSNSTSTIQSCISRVTPNHHCCSL
jgi:hypothetical protein